MGLCGLSVIDFVLTLVVLVCLSVLWHDQRSASSEQDAATILKERRVLSGSILHTLTALGPRMKVMNSSGINFSAVHIFSVMLRFC